MSLSSEYFVYIVECSDGTLYTGIARNVERRVREHNSSQHGAKYTRTRRPVQLVYTQACADRSAALKEEMRIKQLSRPEKLALLKLPDIG